MEFIFLLSILIIPLLNKTSILTSLNLEILGIPLIQDLTGGNSNT